MEWQWQKPLEVVVVGVVGVVTVVAAVVLSVKGMVESCSLACKSKRLKCESSAFRECWCGILTWMHTEVNFQFSNNHWIIWVLRYKLNGQFTHRAQIIFSQINGLFRVCWIHWLKMVKYFCFSFVDCACAGWLYTQQKFEKLHPVSISYHCHRILIISSDDKFFDIVQLRGVNFHWNIILIIWGGYADSEWWLIILRWRDLYWYIIPDIGVCSRRPI